jgi:8-oxo-dGTP pyrophosphatase MutT (NUDIX family)
MKGLFRAKVIIFLLGLKDEDGAVICKKGNFGNKIMPMTIFLNEREILFVHELPDTILVTDITVTSNSVKVLRKSWLDFQQNDKFLRLIIVDPSVSNRFFSSDGSSSVDALANCSERFKSFVSLFKYIAAAGGLVRNEKQEYLFIYRFGLWDLPKGKISKKDFIHGDFAKATQRAAIREVQEETGLEKVKIVRHLPCTWHIYNLKEKQILKQTYWYEMAASSQELLKPQTEEGILLVKWISSDNLQCIVENTYRSIKELLVLQLPSLIIHLPEI